MSVSPLVLKKMTGGAGPAVSAAQALVLRGGSLLRPAMALQAQAGLRTLSAAGALLHFAAAPSVANSLCARRARAAGDRGRALCSHRTHGHRDLPRAAPALCSDPWAERGCPGHQK